MTPYGGSLIQSQGIGAAGNCDYVGEIVPTEATITAHRRTTPLFGLGLVDAVPDTTFYAIAAAEASNPDGITGTVSVVTNIATGQNAVGKFGWKGQNPTLFQFSGDAYVNEMGITSPEFPDGGQRGRVAAGKHRVEEVQGRGGRPGRTRRLARDVQRQAQPGRGLGVIAPDHREQAERGTKSHRGAGVARVAGEVEGGEQIVPLGGKRGDPGHLARPS